MRLTFNSTVLTLTLVRRQRPTRRRTHTAAHNPFVWHNNSSEDRHRISEGLLYYPALLTGSQQRTLLNAALERLDADSGSHASRRRKRIRPLRSTDTSLTPNNNFLPDEHYDFEQVSRILIGSPPPVPVPCPFLIRPPRGTLTKSSSNSERPASLKTGGPTKKMSSPSSAKSPLCSHQYPSRHTYYTSPPKATSFPTSITFKRAVRSSLVSA